MTRLLWGLLLACLLFFGGCVVVVGCAFGGRVGRW